MAIAGCAGRLIMTMWKYRRRWYSQDTGLPRRSCTTTITRAWMQRERSCSSLIMSRRKRSAFHLQRNRQHPLRHHTREGVECAGAWRCGDSDRGRAEPQASFEPGARGANRRQRYASESDSGTGAGRRCAAYSRGDCLRCCRRGAAGDRWCHAVSIAGEISTRICRRNRARFPIRPSACISRISRAPRERHTTLPGCCRGAIRS